MFDDCSSNMSTGCVIVDGLCFEDALFETLLLDLPNIGTKGTFNGVAVRDYFASYFTSFQDGVSWKYNM